MVRGASLECGGRRRFGPRRPGAASLRNIELQRSGRLAVGPQRRRAAALQGETYSQRYLFIIFSAMLPIIGSLNVCPW